MNAPRPWEGANGRTGGEVQSQFSTFNGCHDNAPKHHIGDLKDIIWKDQTGLDKSRLQAISGAEFLPGTRRATENVLWMHHAILDLDNAEEQPTGEFWPDPRTGRPTNRPKLKKVPIANPATLEEALGVIHHQAYLWTTWSNQPDWPRSRILFPLARPVPPSHWLVATEWILRESGLDALRRGLDLPVLRNVAGLHYLPAQNPSGPPVERYEVSGPLLDVPWETLDREGTSPASETDRSWAARFTHQGTPLDLRTLRLAELLEALGCKVGRDRGRKRRCSCPWWAEHSHPDHYEDCAVIFSPEGRWPEFHCSHSGHAHLGLKDVLDLAGFLEGGAHA